MFDVGFPVGIRIPELHACEAFFFFLCRFCSTSSSDDDDNNNNEDDDDDDASHGAYPTPLSDSERLLILYPKNIK